MTAAQHRIAPILTSLARFAAVASVSTLLAACASGGSDGGLGLGLGDARPEGSSVAEAGSTDMGKALNYWGREFQKNPADKKAALNYALNLKAAGERKQAFLVLQHASTVHGNDREIASEYGRLALEEDQIALANKLLALADDHANPDWRIVSGRGAALAKLGRYGEAVEMFKRAHSLAPANPTVLNNLAMAHAGNRNLDEAERLLRQAADNPMARDKVAKNLALVLRLKGRDGEADKVASGQTPVAAMAGPGGATNITTSSTVPRQKRAPVRRSQAAAQLPIRASVSPTPAAPLPVVARSTL